MDKFFGYDQYFKKIPDSLKAKWVNWKKNIELGFTQRISSEDKAFEVGFYKRISINTQTGEQGKSFGRFHVLLRKENGTWKIIMMLIPGKGLPRRISTKPARCSYNCFQITAKIKLYFDKNPELYNKR